MIELLLVLAAEPVVQTAPAETPASVTVGDLTVADGGMMAWTSGDQLGGQVTVMVQNDGTGTDRVLSVSTPAGTVGRIGVYPVVGGRGERLQGDDRPIGPGRTGILAELDGIASGQPAPTETTITVVFEIAGEVTVRAVPTAPAPPAPPVPVRPVPTPRR